MGVIEIVYDKVNFFRIWALPFYTMLFPIISKANIIDSLGC